MVQLIVIALFSFLSFLSVCIPSKERFSSSPYIIAESDAGLGNRIRSMLAHAFLAKFIHGDAHLLMIWDINNACPGHFLQYFQPIAKITFISNTSRHVFEPHALHVYPSSTSTFRQILLSHEVHEVLHRGLWAEEEMNFWRLLKPLPALESQITNYSKTHNICNASAAHVRLTDLDSILSPRLRFSMGSLYRWIETRPHHQPVYLLTDNPNTQRELLQKYGTQRILFYKLIPLVEKSAGVLQSSAKRLTNLEHTVIDIFIAAHAEDFRPSSFSSLSNLVSVLKYINRAVWCSYGVVSETIAKKSSIER